MCEIFLVTICVWSGRESHSNYVHRRISHLKMMLLGKGAKKKKNWVEMRLSGFYFKYKMKKKFKIQSGRGWKNARNLNDDRQFLWTCFFFVSLISLEKKSWMNRNYNKNGSHKQQTPINCIVSEFFFKKKLFCESSTCMSSSRFRDEWPVSRRIKSWFNNFS